MTGQEQFDRYADAGAFASVDLVNALVREPGDEQAVGVLAAVLAVDPPSVARLTAGDVPGFRALARRLDEVFVLLAAGDLNGAAARLNDLLATYPAHPHLSNEDGRWRMHHHPSDAALVPMWSAICAEGLARIVGADAANRLGTCAGTGCARVFLDESKNAGRRFCSAACNNRARSAAYRRRRVTG